MDYLIVFILILFSALFSGLTLGLMGLDSYELKRKVSLGDKDAKKIYPIRKKGNLLLCTLLIGNTGVNATLSIYLGSIASGLTAGIIATSLIVIFGEITPQAIFSQFSLKLGAKLSWFVRIFIVILYPVCLPISLILDKFLGSEMATVYSKRELMKIFEEHKDSQDSDLGEEEERILKGALTFSTKKVREVMTPRPEVFALESSEKLDEKTIAKILKSGFSRIPVFKNELDKIVGILYLSKLVGNKNLNKAIHKMCEKKALFVDENSNLGHVFNEFLITRKHLFIVVDEFGTVSGIVTIEDVIEEIIGSEIMDEKDKIKDIRERAKERARRIKVV